MPKYNPYLLQLLTIRDKNKTNVNNDNIYDRVHELIGYAAAVLFKYLASGCQGSRGKIEEVLSEHRLARRYASEFHIKLSSIVDKNISYIRELRSRNNMSRLLNDLRRIGVLDIYAGNTTYVSPDDGGWCSNCHARLGPNAGLAVSMLRHCLLDGRVDVGSCLRLASAAAALGFLHGVGGSTKLRGIVRKVLAGRVSLDKAAERIASEIDSEVKRTHENLERTVKFFYRSFEIIQDLSVQYPGLLPPGYLRVIEALGQSWVYKGVVISP